MKGKQSRTRLKTMIMVNIIRWNDEIWRKILNSVASKYDCGVRFSIQGGRLGWEGDGACALEIVKETMALIGVDGC
jgi:hypothetical protein